MKEKENKRLVNEMLWKYVGMERGTIIFGSFFIVCAQVTDILIPGFMGLVIDYLAKGQFDQIYTLCFWMAIIVILTGICVGIRSTIFNILGERISRNLRKEYFDKILRKDIEFFDGQKTGFIISRLNSDIQIIQDSLGSNWSMFLRTVIYIVAVFAIMFTYSWKLTCIVFGFVVPIAAISG